MKVGVRILFFRIPALPSHGINISVALEKPLVGQNETNRKDIILGKK